MPLLQGKYCLDGSSLTCEDLNFIILAQLEINLTPSAWNKVRKSRKIIHQFMSDKSKVVYGINTGFGNFADKILSYDEMNQLQNNLIRSHAVCVGNPVSNSIVKRMTILRINTLAKGRSGIDPKNLQIYIDACNKNYFPHIPQKGTVGASGDLAPLSHLAIGLMGEGKAWSEKEKSYIDAKKVMDQLKLPTLHLKEKEGLALINGTQFMVSILSQVITMSKKIWESAIIIFAISLQIFGYNLDILSDEAIKYYEEIQPQFGRTLKHIKSYLDKNESQLYKDRSSTPKQTIAPLSITQGFQNLNSLLQRIKFCQKIIQEQMNSATDNPLVFSKEDGFPENVLISAGNFHGEYVAKIADFLSMALFSVGRFSEARIQRYVNDRISNLPGFLIKNGGLNSGYMIVQYTSAALLSQSKVLCKPASADSISTSASQQDHVSMGGYAARKSREMLKNISYILGIQLMCALQALSILQKQPSEKIGRLYKNARKYIRYVQKDVYYGPDIEAAQVLVQNGLGQLVEDH